jgi:hypothetical protein
MAAANQVPMDDVREAILQSAIEAGHTAALLALKKFKELCKKLNPRRVGNDEQIPGSLSFDYFSNRQLVDQGLTAMWKPIMEKHRSRPGLTLKERLHFPHGKRRSAFEIFDFPVLRCHKPLILLGLYGGDDGARTRDLCRDSLAL